MHHFNGKELRCATLTCIVHHRRVVQHGAQGTCTLVAHHVHLNLLGGAHYDLSLVQTP